MGKENSKHRKEAKSGRKFKGRLIAPKVDFPNGHILADRFEIHEIIGCGGMGVVYSAFDQVKKEEIALKVLNPVMVKQEESFERFVNEAKISTSLSHPGIVNVFDIQKDGNIYFIIMEKLRGYSLREEIDRRLESEKPFTVKEAVKLIDEICRTLEYVHNKTIHRDLKPENIWIDFDGKTKIMDFGIARLIRTSRLTLTGTTMGTVDYMAPEQRKEHSEVDCRADQYALAAILYEMLTLEIPSGALEKPHEVRSEISKNLSRAVIKGMKRKPDERFGNIQEFRKAIKKSVVSFHIPFRKNVKLASLLIFIFTVVLGSAGAGLYFYTEKLKEDKYLNKKCSVLMKKFLHLQNAIESFYDLNKSRLEESREEVKEIFKKLEEAEKAQDSQMVNTLSSLLEIAQRNLKRNRELNEIINFQKKNDKIIEKFQNELLKAEKLIAEDKFRKAEKSLRKILAILSEKYEKLKDTETVLKKINDMCLPSWIKKIKLQNNYLNEAFFRKFNSEFADIKTLIRNGKTESAGNQIVKLSSDMKKAGNLIKKRRNAIEKVNSISDIEKRFPHLFRDFREGLNAGDRELNHHRWQNAQNAYSKSMILYSLDENKISSIKPEKNKNWEVPGVHIKMVSVENGKFKMGSMSEEDDEKPVHTVILSKPFWIAVFETTQKQYQTLMGDNPSRFNDPEKPVDSVSWNDAVIFCERLTEKEKAAGRLPENYIYRLPTEAEWEFACKNGTDNIRFAFGDSQSILPEYAWYSKNSKESTHKAGNKKTNALGIYDVHGNVWEWCLDWYDDSYKKGIVKDPKGPIQGTEKIAKGGSWRSQGHLCRSGYRAFFSPSDTMDYVGFRIVLAKDFKKGESEEKNINSEENIKPVIKNKNQNSSSVQNKTSSDKKSDTVSAEFINKKEGKNEKNSDFSENNTEKNPSESENVFWENPKELSDESLEKLNLPNKISPKKKNEHKNK